jgi:hypothetical protein
VNVPIQERARQIAEHLNIAHKRIKDLEASTMGDGDSFDDGAVDVFFKMPCNSC